MAAAKTDPLDVVVIVVVEAAAEAEVENSVILEMIDIVTDAKSMHSTSYCSLQGH